MVARQLEQIERQRNLNEEQRAEIEVRAKRNGRKVKLIGRKIA